ncbi:MAG: AbrB/MazE/SpoVT family DNA-binding domain-containing protein [Candidatus Babeliales bacterium]
MVMLVRRNFQVTLPETLRKRLGIDVGDILEAEIKDGKIVLLPKKMIDADQAYFWSKGWQAAEKEAQQDIKTGKVKKFDNVSQLIKELDK